MRFNNVLMFVRLCVADLSGQATKTNMCDPIINLSVIIPWLVMLGKVRIFPTLLAGWRSLEDDVKGSFAQRVCMCFGTTFQAKRLSTSF